MPPKPTISSESLGCGLCAGEWMAKGFCHFADFATKRLYHIPRCRNRRLQTSFLKSLLLDSPGLWALIFLVHLFWHAYIYLGIQGEARRLCGSGPYSPNSWRDRLVQSFVWVEDFRFFADRRSHQHLVLILVGPSTSCFEDPQMWNICWSWCDIDLQ